MTDTGASSAPASEIDVLEAEIAELMRRVTTLITAIADLDHSGRDASEHREEREARNTRAIADPPVAQTNATRVPPVLVDL